MFSYNKYNSIISCTFVGTNIAGLDPNEIFRAGSMWADCKLLSKQSSICCVDWLESNTWVKDMHQMFMFLQDKNKNCSLCEYANGSFSKDCKWQVRIRTTENTSCKVLSRSLEGKYNAIPLVDDGVPIITSTANCQHTGSCNPSTQQQIIQCTHSGEYIK